MSIGPGKYDDLCTAVREAAKAQVAIVIIVNGDKGSGFSCQAIGGGFLPDMLEDLPDMLEDVAKQIRADMQKKQLQREEKS